jgi:hypothetical protein
MRAYARGALPRPSISYAYRNQVDGEVNRQHGLPALQGSPKQVQWAESIRRRQMEAASQYTIGRNDNQLVDAAISLSQWTQAAHWIARKDASVDALLDEAMRNPGIGRRPPPGRRYFLQDVSVG